MYAIHNQGKSVVTERFITTLKTKIQKYIPSISKNVYIDKVDNIVNEYNNTYHRTIKMKPVDVKDNTYIDLIESHSNDKDPKFKVGDHVRFSTYKHCFGKGYTPSWSEEFFGITKVTNTVPWTYIINDLMVKKLLEHFMKKNYKKLINKNVKWKGYVTSFNSWIDKK